MAVWDDTFEELLRRYLPFAEPGVPIRPTAELVSLGADSVVLLTLMMSVENAYQIEFPADQLNEAVFRTPGSIWAATTALRAGAAR